MTDLTTLSFRPNVLGQTQARSGTRNPCLRLATDSIVSFCGEYQVWAPGRALLGNGVTELLNPFFQQGHHRSEQSYF